MTVSWLVFAIGLVGRAAAGATGTVLYQQARRLPVSVLLSRAHH
jgi:hypothetical protein